MQLLVNGQEIAAYPSEFSVTILDLDDAETTTRTVDGTLSRDRVAVKRQIDMRWPALTWDKVSALLQSMENIFFEFTYPDPMTGKYETKTFYVGNRTSPIAFERNGTYWWGGLEMTLTER